MDKKEFFNRINLITLYIGKKIFIPKERAYYYAYIRKLKNKLKYLHCPNEKYEFACFKAAVLCFNKTEKKRMKDGFLIKPVKMIDLAVSNVLDILESMKRWEGVDTNDTHIA